MKTIEKLGKIQLKNNSLVCVGLDPELEKLPAKLRKSKEAIFEFNKKIIEETAPFVCAFKPNIAFYEAYGIEGLRQLKKTFEFIHKKYAGIPVILDAKRADIPNTAKMYAKSAFDYWQADAVTVYPNLGWDSLEPFFKYKNKLTILLLKTSNPDSSQFQNLKTQSEPYYLKMAKVISKWDVNNMGMLVGATYQKEMAKVRKIFPDKFFLSPGIGAQGAEAGPIVKAGVDKNGAGIAFNASRSIIYNQNPATAAQKLRDEINKYR